MRAAPVVGSSGYFCDEHASDDLLASDGSPGKTAMWSRGSASPVEYPRPMTTLLLRRLTLRPGEEHRVVLDVDVDPFTLGGVEYVVGTPGPG